MGRPKQLFKVGDMITYLHPPENKPYRFCCYLRTSEKIFFENMRGDVKFWVPIEAEKELLSIKKR